MKNPFFLSEDRLKTLLEAFATWNQGEDYSVKQANNAEDIKSKLLNKTYIEETQKEKLVQDILSYSKALEGPAHINIGVPRVSNEFDKIKRNLIYLIDSPDDPIKKAVRILDGDYKIQFFSKAFWTPIFQAQYPGILPNWNNKTENFLKKIGVNLKTSKLSVDEKYRFISEAFLYLQKIDTKQNFHDLNHLMHYGCVIPEGIKLIEELEGKIEPNDDLSSKIAEWRQSHISETRLSVREKAEAEARSLLKSKVDNFNEDDLRNFFKLINRDYSNEKVQHNRFQMAYVGKNVNELVNQLDVVNEWISRFWGTSKGTLKELLDEYYQNPIKNAGTAFPSLILYLSDTAQFNLCFKRMEKGLKILVSFKSVYIPRICSVLYC